MIRAWQELMMNLALAVASSSSGTAKAVSENLHKLAVASGAPDWEGLSSEELEGMRGGRTLNFMIDLTLDDGNALFIRAEKYMMGLGVAQSFESAFHSYAQAAARCGHNESMNMLGAMYELGLGVDKNAFDAMKWYEKAAAADNADAMTNLARLLETRKTLEDAAAACSWYLRAAEKGHPDAMTRLGYLLEHGIGQNAPQPELAVQWYRMAATFEGTGATGERAGRIAAIAAVAWGPPNETDRLMGGSHLGCARARAQNALGNCFYKGIGVERNYEEAVMWYKKAADQGAPYAQNNLGICYEEGLGVARDLLMAKSLYKAASEVRHPSGTNNYGYMLLLEGNPLEALRMFHVASALGR
ncbi:hypothetical protein DFJ73DRAFT_338168 [Zopfochytrium polystomum]|nr:hypothetical protein DFJ73DRAFT_338168 [Zopfochytrium polystomum]